ncbi:MAG: hypothetical protein AB1598_14220 [Thermodesulfobacteriota bacterium]
MKRFLVFTAAGLMLTGAGLGALPGTGAKAQEHGSYEDYQAQPQYNVQDTGAMESEFANEMKGARAQQDPNEMERRQYIPRFMEGSSGTVLGTVTLVGDDEMRIVESGTGIEHEIKITEAQQKQLTTGFNISAELENGRLVSFVEEGVPPDVEKIVYDAENLPTDNILEQRSAF